MPIDIKMLMENTIYIFVRALKRSIWNLFDLPKKTKEFGWQFAIKDTALKICFNWTQSPSLFEKKHRNIFLWLEQNYPDEIKKMAHAHLSFEPDRVKRIWVMWWQGLDNAPVLVKKCTAILKDKSQDYELVFLDKNNYADYVDIPTYITEKFNRGKISVANYSDVIRMALLYKYGGFWIDSTVLVRDGWDKNYSELPFFSIKNHLTCIDGAVSKFRFATFFMFSKKKNTYFGLIRDFLFDYWKRQESTIDYMLIDYVMLMICHHNKEFQDMLDKVPYTNENVHTLRNHMGEEYTPERFNELTKDTQIFKLTYKDFLIPKVRGVKSTIMQYFLEKY